MTYAPPVGVLAAAFALAIGFVAQSIWGGVVAAVLLGALWLAGLRFGWGWIDAPGLVSFVGAASLGVYQGAEPLLMVACVCAALAAWDLASFQRRLRAAGERLGEAALVRDRVRRLLIVLGVPLLLGVASRIVRIELSFWWALLLALLVVVGLRALVLAARREQG